MDRIHRERSRADPSDGSIAADVLLRQEPDEEEDDEEEDGQDDGNDEDHNDDSNDDDGYSE